MREFARPYTLPRVWMAMAVCALALAEPHAEQVVVGVLDAAPEPSVSALLDETAAWLRQETVLSMAAGDQVGLDRATLAACPADRLYSCLSRAILEIPSRPRVAVLIARARRGSVLLLVFESEALERTAPTEAEIYGAIRRIAGTDLRSALEGLRVVPGFEAPARARVEAAGCAPCVVHVGARELVLDRDGVTFLQLRPGPTPVSLSVDGDAVSSTVAPMRADRPVTVRVLVSPSTPAWQGIAATALAVGGAGALVAGIAIAGSRADLLCVTRGAGCAPLDPNDPRVVDYESTGNTARIVGISGAVALGLGALWWAIELVRDDGPKLWIE